MVIRPFPQRDWKVLAAEVLAVGGAMAAKYFWDKWRKERKMRNDICQRENKGEYCQEDEAQFPFGRMECAEGSRIALKCVSVNGDAHGLLFSMRIRQEFANETPDPLEIIYTFPLAFGTTLLGMEARIGEKVLHAEIIEKQQAEDKYEEALEGGDSAIMLQKSASGLYTANLGNIKPREKVEVELHCARLLAFEQGRIRISVPTVIGQRYGDEHAQGGLAAHETANADANVKYPFSIRITLHGDMAKGNIVCPSHEAAIAEHADGKTVEVSENGFMDRDFVLVLDHLIGNSHAIWAEDENNFMACASFCPKLPEAEISPIALKILVDCSGSMSGDSMIEARKGLDKILSLLRPSDYVAYSRFGSHVEHMLDGLLPCDKDRLALLSSAIDATAADLGGTEMAAALEAVLDPGQDAGRNVAPAILLITDGFVWDVKNIVAKAKKSGQRIFALGVGSAPAESLLRDLAFETGGACEFVTPNESISEAIVRMFHRMRGRIARDIRVDWGQMPVWHSCMSKYIYDGETLHVFALLERQPAQVPVLSFKADGEDGQAICVTLEKTDCKDLPRMGRERQMEECENEAEKLALALKYELVSDLTSAILVYERQEADKIKGLPKIQQVPQMASHGHGCFMASSMNLADSGFLCSSVIAPPIWQRGDIFRRRLNFVKLMGAKDDAKALWSEKLPVCSSMGDFVAFARRDKSLRDVVECLADVAAETGIEEEIVWSAYISLIIGEDNLDRHSRRLLRTAQPAEEQFKMIMNELKGGKPFWPPWPPVVY